MTPEISEALEKWHNSGGFEASFPEDCIDTVHLLASAFVAEHPSGAPSAIDDDDCIKWPEPEKRRVPNPLDEELREAKRLLKTLATLADSLDVVGQGHGDLAVSAWGQSLTVQDCRDARAFLARTSWVEQQEKKQ